MPTQTTIRPDPQTWLRIINRMIDKPDYDFALDFLSDIRDQILDKDFITNRQTQAVLNIRRSVQ